MLHDVKCNLKYFYIYKNITSSDHTVVKYVKVVCNYRYIFCLTSIFAESFSHKTSEYAMFW